MIEQSKKLLVLGIGNPHCGDDGVGAAVVERLKHLERDDMMVKAIPGEASETIAAMRGHHCVVLVDAVVSRNAVGALHVFDASHVPLPLEIFGHFSTHSFGIADAIELARALGELPTKLVVLGIEGERFEPGDSLSPKVSAAIESATEWIIERSPSYSLI